MEPLAKVEVRCCCQPQKLLGWVEVPRAKLYEGHHVRLLVTPDPRALLAVGASPAPEIAGFAFLSLPIARIATPENSRGWLAVKAEGVPLSTLRRVAGFIENRE